MKVLRHRHWPTEIVSAINRKVDGKGNASGEGRKGDRGGGGGKGPAVKGRQEEGQGRLIIVIVIIIIGQKENCLCCRWRWPASGFKKELRFGSSIPDTCKSRILARKTRFQAYFCRFYTAHAQKRPHSYFRMRKEGQIRIQHG